MKTWLAAFGLVICISVVAFGRLSARTSTAKPSEDDFRKMEQAWLDAASAPDLPALRKMFSDDFMGTSFGGGACSAKAMWFRRTECKRTICRSVS